MRRRCRWLGTLLELVVVALVATCGESIEDLDDSTAPAASPSVALKTPSPSHAVPSAPQPSITARVIVDGAPAADAEVWLNDGNAAISARTGKDGVARFTELASGPYELWATRHALASAVARVGEAAPDSSVELALAPAASLRGRVKADGPVQAVVHVIPLDIDQAARTASLDEQGRYAVEGLPAGHWRVEVDATGFVQRAPHVVQLSDVEATLDVELERASSVTGTVVDASGKPVANATLVLREQAGAVQRPFAITSTKTRWIHPLAGTRWLPANDSTYFGAPRPGFRPPECGHGHCGLDLGNTRGTVIHAVANGVVATLFPEPTTEAGKVVVVQHANGVKSFYMHLDELRPGLEIGQPIHAGDPVGLLGSTGFTRSVPHLHFAITYEHGGRTWYLDPEPVIRRAVVLPAAKPYEPVVTAPAKAETDATLAVHTVTSDARGAFTIDGAMAGSYVAVAYAPDFPPAGSTPFTVKAGETARDVVVHLAPGALVDGRVLGKGGAIAGATVMAIAGFGESANKIAMTTTDKNGEFRLSSLAGKITLEVSAAGYGALERPLALDDNARTRHHEEFRLTIEDSVIRGQLFAPQGGAAAGVIVRIVEGTTRRTTVSNAQGRFGMPVASGRYVVELSSADYPTKRVTIDSGRWIEERLEAGGGVTAIVRDAQSAALLANVRVEATGPAGQTVAKTTDARGIAPLRGLAAGEWKLSARATGYVAATRAATVRVGGAAPDVQLELAHGATVGGVVRDGRGQRVAGARVWLGTATTQSDADGNFKLVEVPIGAGMVEAELDGRHGGVQVQLAPGDERMTLTIELSN